MGSDAVGSGRHAALHDFCMAIPYGGILTLGGLVALFLGGGIPSLLVTVAGGAMIALSRASLQAWRAERPAPLVTLAGAGEQLPLWCLHSSAPDAMICRRRLKK
jgi:hypothetical protein